jgi:D-threo-aldose 1-dehydrogenase
LDQKHEILIERIADLVDLDFLVVAGAYTLLETRALRRIMPLCKERGIGVIIAAPYASGWLVAPDETSTYMYGPVPQEMAEKSNRMQAICERYGASLAAAALQFSLAHPSVAAVIPGAKTAAEATENLHHLNSAVPDAVWESFKADGLLDPLAPTPES